MKKRILTAFLFCLIAMVFLPGRANAASVALNSTNFPDSAFRSAVAKLDTNGDGYLSDTEANVATLTVENCGITNLKGIEYFHNLQYLYCRKNQLTALPLQNNSSLRMVDCSYNNLISLNLGSNTNLTSIYCDYNSLTSVNVAQNTALQTFSCEHNNLSALDVRSNSNLKSLYCSNNPLKSLNVTANKNLSSLECRSNQLTTLDVSCNSKLGYLDCADNALTALNVGSNTSLKNLYCSSNQLTKLTLPASAPLVDLRCFSNSLTSLNVSAFSTLEFLYCSNNNLSSLNLTGNTALKLLRCNANQLTSLDISKTQVAFSGYYISYIGSQQGSRTISVKMTDAQKEDFQANRTDKYTNYDNERVTPVSSLPTATLSITTQPASQTVASGSSASFKVTASGASSYQWQWRSSSSGTWANCSSATAGYNTATLKPVGTAARNGYQYRCVVKGASGSVTSSTVTLKVLAITAQPASQSVSLNASASFKVTALNAASYQWQWRSSSSGTWANCSSATTGYNAATLKPVGTAARNGYQYRCVIKDSAGHSVTSNAVTLTVKSGSLSITAQPTSQTVAAGSSAAFKVTASGASSYQWQWRADSSGTWANCSSATAGYNTATLKPVGTAARNGYQYRCVVKGSSGSVTSNTVTLKVLAITTQPVSQSVSLNASASFKVTALNAASYQWQWRSSSSGTWANCSSATTGYNAATLKPVGTAARNGYQYRCVIKDSAGHSVTSNAVTLTVKSSGPSITGQPVSQTVSKDSYASFTVTASGSGLSYQWQWRASSSGTWANCSSATAGYNRATLNPMGTAARNGYQYRCIVKNSSGGSATSNTVTLTVK